LRRFVSMLPVGFHNLRHHCLYAAALAEKRALARERLSTGQSQPRVEAARAADVSDSWADRLREITGRDVSRCPTCDAGLLRLPIPTQRAPPPGSSP
jgi:hypothetical protein